MARRREVGEEMTRKYTAADFANAQFAELGKHGLRAHKSAGDSYWQRDGIKRATNEEMADAGWVPVPTKPTLTDSEVGELVPINLPEEYLTGFIDGFEEAGGTIIPDPEPTNTDRLEKLIISAPGNFEGVEAILKRPANVRAWAVYLNDHGVTAPNVKGN